MTIEELKLLLENESNMIIIIILISLEILLRLKPSARDWAITSLIYRLLNGIFPNNYKITSNGKKVTGKYKIRKFIDNHKTNQSELNG